MEKKEQKRTTNTRTSGGKRVSTRTPKKQTRTEIGQNKMIEALRATAGIISPALEMAGVGRTTFHEWRTKDPEFAERVDNITKDQHDFVETKLIQGIKSGSERLIEFYLDRRVPQYAKKTFHDITTQGEKMTAAPIIFVPADQDEQKPDNG